MYFFAVPTTCRPAFIVSLHSLQTVVIMHTDYFLCGMGTEIFVCSLDES